MVRKVLSAATFEGREDGSHTESQEKNIHSTGNRNAEPGGRVGSVPRKHMVWPVWLEGSLERSLCPHLNETDLAPPPRDLQAGLRTALGSLND